MGAWISTAVALAPSNTAAIPRVEVLKHGLTFIRASLSASMFAREARAVSGGGKDFAGATISGEDFSNGQYTGKDFSGEPC